MFTKYNNSKVKSKMDGKINLYSQWIDFNFKKFATIDKEERCDSLKDLIQLQGNVILLFKGQKKYRE